MESPVLPEENTMPADDLRTLPFPIPVEDGAADIADEDTEASLLSAIDELDAEIVVEIAALEEATEEPPPPPPAPAPGMEILFDPRVSPAKDGDSMRGELIKKGREKTRPPDMARESMKNDGRQAKTPFAYDPGIKEKPPFAAEAKKTFGKKTGLSMDDDPRPMTEDRAHEPPALMAPISGEEEWRGAPFADPGIEKLEMARFAPLADSGAKTSGIQMDSGISEQFINTAARDTRAEDTGARLKLSAGFDKTPPRGSASSSSYPPKIPIARQGSVLDGTKRKKALEEREPERKEAPPGIMNLHGRPCKAEPPASENFFSLSHEKSVPRPENPLGRPRQEKSTKKKLPARSKTARGGISAIKTPDARVGFAARQPRRENTMEKPAPSAPAFKMDFYERPARSGLMEMATSENPELCVALPRQNARLPNANSAFVSVANLEFGVFGGCQMNIENGVKKKKNNGFKLCL